jgi:acetoin utilization protein AcuB
MTVEGFMNKSIVTVEMDDLLSTVREIFDNVPFHHLLVVESGKLVGVVSDRDLLKALSPNIGTAAETTTDSATLNKRVHQIMTRKPVTLKPKAGIYDAIEIFNNHNISCIPVVDDEYKPIGIMSWRDILKAIGSKRDKHPDSANQQGGSYPDPTEEASKWAPLHDLNISVFVPSLRTTGGKSIFAS